MSKHRIREEYRKKRETLTQQEINNYSNKINRLLIDNFNFKNKTAHTFFSINNLKEFDTSFINDFFFNTCKNVSTSITEYSPLSLKHSIVTRNSEFVLDKFNIPTPTLIKPIQPNEIDIVIVPLLTFDNNGNRIGYGKGLYDSFLKECRSDCIKIGVSFFKACSENINIDQHDVKLNACVTPNKIYHF